MQLRLTYPRLAGGLVAGIAIGLFASGVAYAVTSNVFRYSTQQTGSLSINSAALGPDNQSISFHKDHGGLDVPVGNGGCFRTGLVLPDGARLRKLKVWYLASVAEKLEFALARYSNNTAAEQPIVDKFNTDTSSNLVSETYVLSGPRTAINNTAFSYVLVVCFQDNDEVFTSARLTYTYRDAGD